MPDTLDKGSFPNGTNVTVLMPLGFGRWQGTVAGEDYHRAQTLVEVTSKGDSVYAVGERVWVMTKDVQVNP
jgi:hypothetical protein